MDYKEAKKMVKHALSEKRYKHTVNVKKMAVKLARKHGADPDKAAMAAILHDACKEKPRAELLQMMRDNAIIANGTENRPSPVWHGVCAAIMAQTCWGVQDPDILSAISCHTTGKVGMNLLDKIIFIADMTSAERDYPGVEELRRMALEDIDKAMIRGLQMTIHFVEEKQNPVDEESLRALQNLLKQAS